MKLTIKQVNESLKLFGMQAQRDSKTEVSVKQAGKTIYSASSLQEVVGFYNGVQFTKLSK